jgi:hypothetical protein
MAADRVSAGSIEVWRVVVCIAILATVLGVRRAEAQEKRWSDADLVTAYADLRQGGGLDRAIRSPTRPNDPPQPAFLASLAWFAAQTPNQAGTLSLAQLNGFFDTQVSLYAEMLTAKVERQEANDYSRTRTWKVIQKLTLLRDEMARPGRDGRYLYVALPKATAENDPWEVAHTVASPEEFTEKVCRASRDRPILVKFGNTNCTQCMLFELTGAVKRYADGASSRGPIDVYKVWFGLRPDSTFAGLIRDPKRLDDLAKLEGVQSSPTFIVYRSGRRYTCGDGFPDEAGGEAHLDTCLAKVKADAPVAGACAGAGF